ncbi:MAG: hypothetical protein E4H20_08685, partial [Spirochaetales bacterium]
AFTAGQAALIKRYAGTVVLCFDADIAGRKAAERAIGIAEAAGLSVLALKLSEGKDPAELMQKYGPERLKKEAESTINSEDFLLNNAADLFSGGGAEGISAVFAYLFPFIAESTSELRRDAFIETAAARFRADPGSVRADFDRFLKRRIEPRPPEAADRPAFVPGPDADLLASLAAHPAQFAKVRSDLDPASFEDETLRSAFIAIEECYRKDDMSISSIAAAIMDEGLKTYILERAANGTYETDPERFVADGVFGLRERSIRKRIRKLVARIRDYDEERDGDETSLNDLLYEKMFLDGELTRIKEERHGRS